MAARVQKYILFILLFTVLLLPLAQSFNCFDDAPELDGTDAKPPKPDFKWFTWHSWFSEKFQTDFNRSLEAHTGLKNFFIRLSNHVDFALFKHTTTLKALVGKNGCLFEEGYIWEYTGRGFIGKENADTLLNRFKDLQVFLKNEKDIDLIMVFEPGKASYFPEYIPDRFDVANKTTSNYDYYTEACKRMKINHLDLNSLFMQMKDTATYPLYPMYGIHWSTYGMYLAADTLIKFMEHTRGINMPNLIWDSLVLTNQLKDADFDIEKTLNLLWRLKPETLAYPVVSYETDTFLHRPNVLIISDSYFWSIWDNHIPHNAFGEHAFWYYNKAVYPNVFGDNIEWVDHTRDREAVESADIILVMSTEMNLHQRFWGFVDDVYSLYLGEK